MSEVNKPVFDKDNVTILGVPEKFLKLIIDNLSLSVFWKDRNSVYLGANKLFTTQAGLKEHESIIGKTDYDLAWSKKEADFYRFCDKRVMTSKEAELNIIEPQQQEDGKQAWLETSKMPVLDDMGNVIGLLGMYQDISETKNFEENNKHLIHELQAKNITLRETMDELVKAQSQLIFSEKMSTLGQLVARITHEVNTPLGAIKAMNESMQESFDMSLIDMPTLMRKLSDVEFECFQFLLNNELNKSYTFKTSREERLLKKELAVFLTERNITHSTELVQRLVDMNMNSENIPMIYPLFECSNCAELIKQAHFFMLQKRTYYGTLEAVNKASNIVKALKTYSHTQADRELDVFDVKENIDSILTLYSNYFKIGSVAIVKNYSNEPIYIKAYSDEIGQIWVNLITNALDAMNNNGTLCVDLECDSDTITVKIKDSGTGIASELLEKVFQPFYTTKAKGYGTGLGLDIVNSIINRHKGTIHVDSELNEGTVFTITLPKNC